jgi:hypothetical protein
MNSTVQLVLTYSILILVILYVGYKLIKTLFPKKQDIVGCGSNCGCDSVKLKKEILEAGRNKPIVNS